MYVAICDDEIEHINQLENHMIKLREELKNLRWKTFDNAEDFLKTYNNGGYEIDILITDIEMGMMNGVQLAMKIREINKNIIIFFLTSHTDYAIQCFRPEPMNFWIKPIEYGLFECDMKRAAQRIEESQKYITIMEDRFPIRINYTDIKYIEKLDRKTIIHTTSGEHYTNKLISHIQSELPEESFVRIYISYIVNLAYVSKISDKDVFVKGEKTPLIVSRNYIGDLRKRFIAFKERKVLSNGHHTSR